MLEEHALWTHPRHRRRPTGNGSAPVGLTTVWTLVVAEGFQEASSMALYSTLQGTPNLFKV